MEELLLVPVAPAPSRTTRALRVLRRWSPSIAGAVALLLLRAHDHAPLLAVLLAGKEEEGSGAGTTLANERGRAYQVEAVKSGTVEALKYHTSASAQAATSIVMAILADSAGAPGSVLQEKERVAKPGENAAYEITGFSVSVTAGTKYWLVVLPIGGGTVYKKGAGAGGRKSNSTGKKVSEFAWSANEEVAPIFIVALGTESGTPVTLVPASVSASTSSSMAAVATGFVVGTAQSESSTSVTMAAPGTFLPTAATASTSRSAAIAATAELVPGAAAVASSSSAAIIATVPLITGTATASTSAALTIVGGGATLAPTAAVAVTSATATLSPVAALTPAAASATSSATVAVESTGFLMANAAKAVTSRSLVIEVAGGGAEPPTVATFDPTKTSATITGLATFATFEGLGSSAKLEPTPTSAVLSGG